MLQKSFRRAAERGARNSLKTWGHSAAQSPDVLVHESTSLHDVFTEPAI